MYSVKKLHSNAYAVTIGNVTYLYRILSNASIVNQVYSVMSQVQYSPDEITEELFNTILYIVEDMSGVALEYNEFFRMFDNDVIDPRVFQYLNTVRKLIKLNKIPEPVT